MLCNLILVNASQVLLPSQVQHPKMTYFISPDTNQDISL